MTAPQAVAVSHWTRRTITPPTPYHTHQDTYHPLTAQEGTNPMTEHRPTPIHSPSIMSFLIASRNLTAAFCCPHLPRSPFGSAKECSASRSGILIYAGQTSTLYNTQQSSKPSSSMMTLGNRSCYQLQNITALLTMLGLFVQVFFSENHSHCNSDSPPPFSCPRFRNPEPGRLKEKFPQPRSIWSSKFFILKLTPPIRCVNWNPNMEEDHGAIQRGLLEVGPRVDGATPRSASPTICPSIGLSLPRGRIYGARP